MTPVLALVTFQVYPTRMGGQKGVALFYKYLRQHLPVVELLSHDNVTDNTTSQQAILYRNRYLFLNIFLLPKLVRLVKRFDIKLIVVEHSYPGWIGYALRKLTGCPFVIHSHNLETIRFKYMNHWWWRLYGAYEKWIHQKADYSLFISAEDQAYAITNNWVIAAKSSVITYGVEEESAPVLDRETFLRQEALPTDIPLLFFNGTLDYKPNYEAANTLLTIVAPLLEQRIANFKIVVTGNRTAHELLKKMETHPHFIYKGYVPDVAPYYKYTTVFLNPVINNSGVKTKVIEALAHHCTVVSAQSGSMGILKSVTGTKLLLSDDGDWEKFTANIVSAMAMKKEKTPPQFFEQYLWNNIAENAAASLNNVATGYAK